MPTATESSSFSRLGISMRWFALGYRRHASLRQRRLLGRPRVSRPEPKFERARRNDGRKTDFTMQRHRSTDQRVIFFNDGKGGIKVARIARPKQNDAPTKAVRAKDREGIPVLSHLLLRGRISVYFTPKFHLVLGPLDSSSCTSG